MFSAATVEGGSVRGTRSTRRRQRPLSSDSSLREPKPKRQKGALGRQTFVDPNAQPENYDVKPDLPVQPDMARDGLAPSELALARKELSVRSKKPKPGERANKGDGSIVLTTNNAYTVSKLPALPDRLRAEAQTASERQHGAVYSASGYALTLTHTHAFVWPYTSTSPSPETFAFALPHPSKHASEPLPLGSLVAPPASSDEPGLVIVMPVSGRIAYWESISSAATLDFLHQQRTGVEDAISGMYSGEHVVQVVNAEPAGFVVVFSTGRLAYMSVRDGHGRPAVSVQYLRNGLASGGSGFFGSIRSVLGSAAIRGDIAALHAGNSSRLGERAVIAATVKGKVHVWNIHRGGVHEPLAEIEVRQQIVEAIKRADPVAANLGGLLDDSFAVVDFTPIPQGLDQKYKDMGRLNKVPPHEEESTQHLLFLVSMIDKQSAMRYSLVEILVSGNGAQVGSVRPVTSYTSPVRSSAVERPHLCLPRPALVAFIVFDRAVVIASMALPQDGPAAQMHNNKKDQLPATFEDVVDIRDGDAMQISGSGIEEPFGIGLTLDEQRVHRHRTKNPAVVILLQGLGVVRIATADIDRFASQTPPKVTAKSKLEQAVFFGGKDGNPVVFQGRRDLPFSIKEIGDAAVELSDEIAVSRSPFIINVPASLEGNLRTRLGYMESLVSYLNDLGVPLEAPVRWVLLFNAEKMAVATWLWKKHEEFLDDRPKGGSRRTIISEIVRYIHENQKTEANPAIGEVDPVRHWFIHDVFRLQVMLAWGYEIIKYSWKQQQDEPSITRLLYEAVTINDGALRIAHEYRLTQGDLYRVNPSKMPSGDKYPEPWTSAQVVIGNLKRLVEFSCSWLDSRYPSTPSPDIAGPEAALLGAVRESLPSLMNQFLKVLKEQAAWAVKSTDPKVYQYGRDCSNEYKVARFEKIYKLKDFMLWDEAIRLAEEHEATEAMAKVMVLEMLSLEQHEALAASVNPGASEREEAELMIQRKKKTLGEYFDKHGEEFAFQAYKALLNESGVQAVLDFEYDAQGFVTRFLRSRPELSKISWINEVEREKNIEAAGEKLLDVGNRESKIWNKKVELSLAKLAILADDVDHPSDPASEKAVDTNTKLHDINVELDVLKIQDDLYDHIMPSIDSAVDEAAELELALREHAPALKDKRLKALGRVFEAALSDLLQRNVLDTPALIDLLTLIVLPPGSVDTFGDQFFEALRVAHLQLQGQAREAADRLIWRRCYLRDDWKRLNETNDKGDKAQLAAVGGTSTYSAMFALVDERHADDTFNPLVKPSDCLGAINQLPDDQQPPRHDEAFRAALAEALRWEESQLRTAVEKHQLDAWYLSTLDCAERMVAEGYQTLTEEASKSAAAAAAASPARRQVVAAGLQQQQQQSRVLASTDGNESRVGLAGRNGSPLKKAGRANLASLSPVGPVKRLF